MWLLDFSKEHCFLAMIKSLRKGLASGGGSAVLLIDCSKGFDCLPHVLLIAKLPANGVKDVSLNLLFSCFKLENKESHWL